MCRLFALCLALLIVFCGTGACPLGLPENVLVVQNGSSPVSVRVAAHYMSRRVIPSSNLVTIYTQDASLNPNNQLISRQDYQNSIENPIRAYLSQQGLINTIQFVVLTKGIPHRLTSNPPAGTPGGQSVDSALAAMDLVNPITVHFTDESGNNLGATYANRYWRATEPFTHAAYGGYLVTRLDGYTEADAKALVDRALAAQSPTYRLLLDAWGWFDPTGQPESILTPEGTIDPDYDLTYQDYNADMVRASQVVSGRPHLSTQLEATSVFTGSAEPLTGYVSWGSNDPSFSSATYHSLIFASGGIAETAVSTSARTFFPETTGQSLIADLIAQGAAGAKGYAAEPYLDAVASPTVLFDLYTSGRNLAESFYAASRFVGWMDVVLGDPLCALTPTTGAVGTIAAAKSLPDGTLVSLPPKPVSVGSDDFGNRFYIEEQDRSSAIQVYLGRQFPGITRGMSVQVRGLLGKRDGERVITNASVTYAGVGGQGTGEMKSEK
ncbi:MAG: TIGR03790 family protein [Armatimonadetes bacterium]|nr:TIGR03790 family protein [Armatimonadota bacterium]